jgi:hypothetical protein
MKARIKNTGAQPEQRGIITRAKAAGRATMAAGKKVVGAVMKPLAREKPTPPSIYHTDSQGWYGVGGANRFPEERGGKNHEL